MKILGLYVFILVGSVTPDSARAQTFYIFKEDIAKKDMFQLHYESIAMSGLSSGLMVLQDSLPDGTYYFIDLYRKDSAKKEIQNYVYLIGTYKNSIRHGLYEEFVPSKSHGKIQYESVIKYNFKEGRVHGYFYVRRHGEMLEEGYYLEGKKHGFFIYYNFVRKGEIDYIIYFNMDKPVCRVDYKSGEMQLIEFDDE